MKVEIINEDGCEQALLGISLSYDNTFELDKQYKVALKLAKKDGGHNKFLESIQVWIDITAPRYWWQQFDTYRVGTTKQSGSTMHTIMRRNLHQDDFEKPIYLGTLDHLNHLIRIKDFDQLKNELPEGFLQRRIVGTNYKVLRNMILQRGTHKLKEWQFFLYTVRSQVEHKGFLPKIKE